MLYLCTIPGSYADDLESLKKLVEVAVDAHNIQSNVELLDSTENSLDVQVSHYNSDEIRKILGGAMDVPFREVYESTANYLDATDESERSVSRNRLISCTDSDDLYLVHKCSISLSSLSVLENNVTEALDWALKASEVAESLDESDERYWYMQYQSNAFLLIAFIYDRNLTETANIGQEYVQSAINANVKLEAFFLINNISYLARNEIGPSAAIELLKLVEPEFDTISVENQEVMFYAFGKNYAANNQYEEAVEYYLKFQSIQSRADLERAALANLAYIYSITGDFVQAEEASSTAKAMFEGNLETDHGLNILLAEKNIAISQNNFIKALEIDREIDRIDDLLGEKALSANRNRLSKNLQITGERLKRDRDRLEYEAQLSEQQAAASRRQLLLSLTALFFVLAMATWIFRSYKREQKLNAEILVKNDELEETNYQLEGAHDRLQKTFDELQVAHKLALAGQDAKEKFIGVIGHELRTPLNPIINLAGVLEDNCQNTKEKALLTAIKNAGKRLHIIVENMLAISSSDENSKIYVEPIDVVENTTTILREFRTEIETKVAGLKRTNESLNVNVLKSPKLNALQYCNKVIFRSIVRNLFDNALKFTRTGDVVIELRPRPDGSGFIFVIRDTGAGMETSKISDLIEPFQQAEMDLGRAYEGAGLGLTVVQKYCEQLGAKLSIESTVNVGTKITINFPTPAYQVSTGKLLKAA